jgi:AsmA-like C-terminal region
VKPFLQLCRHGLRWCATSLLSLAVWSLWLALVALLGLQVWWMAARQLAVPDFVMDSLERRLAVSQLHATFGRTSFDPTGRILVENVSLSSPAFNEPLVTARTVYVQLDPRALLSGRFEPLELSASGVNFFVPAMLSSSGQSEALAKDVEVAVVPGEHLFEIQYFSALIGRLKLTAHGTFNLALSPREPGAALPIADFIAHDYPRLSRKVADYVAQLAALDDPRLNLELAPSDTRGAIATATLYAQGVRVEQPFPLQASRLVATTRFPLAGETVVKTRLEVIADELQLPGNVVARGVRARLQGVLQPEARTFVPDTAEVSTGFVSGSGFTATSLSADLTLRENPLRGTITARLEGEALMVSGETHLVEKTAALHVEGKFAPDLLRPVSRLVGHDLTKWVGFTDAPTLSADVQLAPGWKFSTLDARVAVPGPYVAYHVALNDGSGRVTIRGQELQATDIITRQGENLARGRYIMNMATLDFRFLLTGQMRPADIGGWFGPWWGRVFARDNFDFRAAVPRADIDVQGRWGEPRLSLEYLGADAPGAGLRGLRFDQVHTRLFIRPGFYDALEFSVARGPGAARGAFAVRGDFSAEGFRGVEFDATSTLDVSEAARMFGESGPAFVAAFQFSTPPRLQLTGRIDGAAAPGGAHQVVRIEETSTGEFGLFGFPLADVAFVADLHDDDLLLNPVTMSFAGGVAHGQAHMWGRGAARRLNFDYALKGANLGQAVSGLEKFFAQRKNVPAPEKSAIFDKTEVRLDLTAAAEGRFEDPYSFYGTGAAELVGPELGQVRLLGLLSELFNFTTLRFTSLQTSLKINGPKLELPDVRLTGANSAIEAHGAYDLARQELDFNAKLYPFGESKFIPQAIIGAVLSPFSKILEVRLTGSLDKPKWAFVRGPTNFLRHLVSTPRPATPLKPDEAVATNKELSPYIKRPGLPADTPKELSPYLKP